MSPLRPPRPLLRRDQATEVPRRPDIPGRARPRQQPLGADPAPSGRHRVGDHTAHALEIRRPRLPPRASPARGVAFHDPLHRLVGRTADVGRAPVSAHVLVGGDDVQLFPHVLQWSSLGGAVTGFDTATVHRPGAQLTDDTSRGWGPHMATSGDFSMATDTQRNSPTGPDRYERSSLRCGAIRWLMSSQSVDTAINAAPPR